MDRPYCCCKYVLSIFFGLIFLGTSSLYSQASYTIKGVVADAQTAEVLPFATLRVFAPDSTEWVATQTSLDGDFSVSFDAPEDAQKAYLSIEFLGYAPLVQDLDLSAGALLELGTLSLGTGSINLEGVEVSAQKSLVQVTASGMKLNIAETSLASSGTALDVLKLTPGMATDAGGNLLFRGRTGLIYIIDGKRSYLSDREINQLLLSLGSDGIETIEILANPPAKYDAAGSAGVVLIKTLKYQKIGLGGTMRANLRVPRRYRAGAGLDFNYRPSYRLNFFGSYGYSQSDNEILQTVFRNISSPDRDYTFDQQTETDTRSQYHNFRLGMDWEPHPQHTLSWVVDGNLGRSRSDNNSLTYLLENSQVDSSIVFQKEASYDYSSLSAGVDYLWKLDTNGTTIQTRIDLGQFDSDNDDALQADFYGPDVAEGILGTELRRAFNPANIFIAAGQIDLTLPFNAFTLEAGWKSSQVSIDNNYLLEELINTEWRNDQRRSNHFLFDEWVHALYSSASFKLGKLSLNTGLRGEFSRSKGHSLTLDERFSRDIFSLFPNVSAQLQTGKNGFNLSYARRINRPSYDALNPFETYLDNYSFYKGNPGLLPQYSHNFEGSYVYNYRYTLALSYGHVNQMISAVPVQDDNTGVIFTTYQNFGQRDYFGLTLSGNIDITKWWSVYTSGGIYLSSTTDTRTTDGSTISGIQWLYGNANHSFAIPGDWKFEVRLNYQGPTDGFWESDAVFSTDLGLRKTFAATGAALSLRYSDIFDGILYGNTFRYQNVDYRTTFQPYATRLQVTYSQPFGNQNAKRERRQGRSTIESERNRAGY